jgi:hypothetical protein
MWNKSDQVVQHEMLCDVEWRAAIGVPTDAAGVAVACAWCATLLILPCIDMCALLYLLCTAATSCRHSIQYVLYYTGNNLTTNWATEIPTQGRISLKVVNLQLDQ